MTFSSLVYHAPSARMIAGNRRNSLHTLRVESFSVLSFESTLGENRPQKSISKHPSQQTFFSSLLQTFKKKQFSTKHSPQAASSHGSSGGSRIFWRFCVVSRCSKDDDQQQFGASIGCLCLRLRGWNDFLPIRELFSISSIPKTPLLSVFPGRHLQFSI